MLNILSVLALWIGSLCIELSKQMENFLPLAIGTKFPRPEPVYKNHLGVCAKQHIHEKVNVAVSVRIEETGVNTY